MRKIMLILLLSVTIVLSGCEGLNNQEELPEDFSVTFRSNGGTEIDSITVEEETSFLEPTVPTKDGYTFAGWYTDSTLNVPYDFSKPVYGDLVLYAAWDPNIVNVLFRSGGLIVDTVETNANTTIDAPEEPMNEGYIFGGWYTDDSYINEFSFDDEITSDTTLYAKWEEIKTLRVGFIHYDLMLSPGALEELEEALKDELAIQGTEYHFVEIELFVDPTLLAAKIVEGEIDVAYFHGNDYVESFDQSSMELILSLTRDMPDISNLDPIWWNENEPHSNAVTSPSPFYRGYLIAGPSTKGRELASIVNSGNELTWADLQDAVLCIRQEQSPSGYLFPNLWLHDNFGHTFNDMDANNLLLTSGYGDSFYWLQNDGCDVALVYPYARENFQYDWSTGNTIWEDTDIIGITREIAFGAMVANKETVSEDIQDAIATAFINITTNESLLAFDELYIDGFTEGDYALFEAWKDAMLLVE